MTSNHTVQGEYFFLPQEHVLFGAGSVAELANEVKRLGGRRALVITGRSLATQTSVVEQVIEALGPLHAGTFTDIRQHTPRSDVTRAIEMARSRGGGRARERRRGQSHRCNKSGGHDAGGGEREFLAPYRYSYDALGSGVLAPCGRHR